MGKFCQRCGRIMKRLEATHCSDECLLADIKNSKSVNGFEGAESWEDTTDPWK